MDLFQYAANLVKSINLEATRKLKDPKPYLLAEDHHGGSIILDRGEKISKGNINSQSRVEKLADGDDYGSLEYHYSPDGCQRSVDWMLANDPGYFMKHIAGCRNRGRGQVFRMDDLQDYATSKLFGSK